jgi:protein TonB
LTRGDIIAARAALDDLRRVEPRHGRIDLLATLVTRAEETLRLAKAPPRPEPMTGTAPGGDAANIATMATTSIAPGATLPAAPADTPRMKVEVAIPVAAPAPAPGTPATTVADSVRTPVASPTDLRPSKLTAVSFAGRTLEDSATSPPPAATPASPARAAPDRPAPVVMEMKLLRSSPPEYPEDARRKRLEGTVDLAFIVGADGKVKDVEVLGSTQPGVFDSEAIDAVKHWRYDPRREDGVPVDHPAKVRLQFKLAE